MKKIVLFITVITLTVCFSWAEQTAAPKQGFGSKPEQRKYQLKTIKDRERDMVFKPIPGLTIYQKQCSPGEISSPRSWDIGSGDSGGTICVPRCGSHYEFIPYDPDNHENVCNGFIGPGSGSVGDERIVGGYTCRFLDDYSPDELPPEDACPTGTTTVVNSNHSYDCFSPSPIPAKLRSCVGEGFTLIDYYDRGMVEDTSRRYVFTCRRSLGPHEICSDPDAQLIGGGGDDNCCAYTVK